MRIDCLLLIEGSRANLSLLDMRAKIGSDDILCIIIVTLRCKIRKKITCVWVFAFTNYGAINYLIVIMNTLASMLPLQIFR